tara:strand:+ start:339 stop:629 length:291 start_codon:yes stop_codon:yes gene_type:complete
MTREIISSYIEDHYPDYEILLADGFEDAFMGIVESHGSYPKALYDEDKCLDILVNDGATYEEAVEHFQFNVAGAYVGEATPAFVVAIDHKAYTSKE